MACYSERAEQCQVMARERKKSQKAIRKKNVKVIKNDDSVDGDNGIVATPDVSDKVADNNVTVQYGDVVKNDEDASDTDDNVTSSYDNVETSVEDVSFSTFMSIYEHQDKGGFDTDLFGIVSAMTKNMRQFATLVYTSNNFQMQQRPSGLRDMCRQRGKGMAFDVLAPS